MYFEKENQHYKYLYIYKHKYMNRYKNVLLEMIKTKTQETHNNCPLFKVTKKEKTILKLYKKL